MTNKFDKDVFSSGQVLSKLWLCENLETIAKKYRMDEFQPLNIWVYGGWHGMMAFQILVRNNLEIGRISSFDIDPHCERLADTYNNAWEWQAWMFKAYTMDCSDFNEIVKQHHYPNIIINTAVEHFSDNSWWDTIPENDSILCALQSNDMDTEDHHHERIFTSLEQFDEEFSMTETCFKGTKNFTYPNWSFNRWMKIGFK